MPLFDRLSSDLTAGWPPHVATTLTFDLRSITVNTVPLGASVFDLLRFGQPSNANPRKEQRFLYFPSGLWIETSEGRVSYFGFVFQDADNAGFSGCDLRVQTDDGVSPVTRNSAESDVSRLFGAPESDEVDDDERLLNYRSGDLTIEAEFLTDGTLARLNVFRSRSVPPSDVPSVLSVEEGPLP